jgi:hypothetical protein
VSSRVCEKRDRSEGAEEVGPPPQRLTAVDEHGHQLEQLQGLAQDGSAQRLDRLEGGHRSGDLLDLPAL